MTLEQFAPIFSTLTVQLRQNDADKITVKSYFAALKDLEVEFVAMAAERLARTAEWFPKTSEWRAMATAIERERVDAQRASLRRLPRPLCDSCSDTGWKQAGSPGSVVPCPCRTQRRLEVLGRAEPPKGLTA